MTDLASVERRCDVSCYLSVRDRVNYQEVRKNLEKHRKEECWQWHYRDAHKRMLSDDTENAWIVAEPELSTLQYVAARPHKVRCERQHRTLPDHVQGDSV